MTRKGIIVILIIAGIIGIGIYQYFYYGNKSTVTTKVTHKERITESTKEATISYYLIFTENGTYKLTDDYVYGNFVSSDWYGKLRIDSTYTFDIVGWRNGFLSMYPNIVKIYEERQAY